MVFRTPALLLLIPVVIILLTIVLWRRKETTLRFPSLSLVGGAVRTWRSRMVRLPDILRLIAVVMFCVALAGPRTVLEKTQVTTEGIDIVLAIDASGSMAAEDFTLKGKRVNRLDVVKDVVAGFIEARQNDRIGLVAFAGLAYTVSPLTSDYAWLTANLERIKLHLIKDGTAVGSAISSALGRLEKSQAKSKVIVLLTDGMNNAGTVTPLESAEAARTLGVKIYTIGAGSKGYAPFPVQDVFGRRRYQKVLVEIDEQTLRKIADLTNGKYYRATDTSSLKEIYAQIDKLEKSRIEQLDYQEYRELFWIFLVAGLLLLVVEYFLKNTLVLKIP